MFYVFSLEGNQRFGVFKIRRFIFFEFHGELTGPVVKFGDFGVYSLEVQQLPFAKLA